MTVLNYKGYQGDATWQDGVVVVRVLHIDDLLSDHCRDASKVEQAFHELVDDYLETCHKLGKDPERPFKGSFNVRISPELHRQAVNAATFAGISLNAWIAEAVQEKVERGGLVRNWISGALLQQASRIHLTASGRVDTSTQITRGAGASGGVFLYTSKGSADPLNVDLMWTIDDLEHTQIQSNATLTALVDMGDLASIGSSHR